MRIGFLPLFLVLVTSQPAAAGWVRCAESIDISNYDNVTTGSARSAASVTVQADGGSMQVFGGAVDVFASIEEAGAGTSVTGSHYECWKFEPDEGGGVGEVEYFAKLRISGAADLIDAHCAGVAAGSERVDAFVDGQLRSSALVYLDGAAGETIAGVLGPFSMKLPGPWGLSIPTAISVTFASGEGLYEDEDEKEFNRVICPAITFEFASQTESIGRVWANEDIALEAAVAIRGKGWIESHCSRLEWPKCPSGSAP